MTILDLISRKQAGRRLGRDDFDFLCRGAVDGSIPDYQLAAWLMAVWFRGMNSRETLALTQAMVGTGATLDWSGMDRPVVDKHSTGGVGDKTSLVLVPLMAAAGLAFAKMSGRGLGHTGGTLDKLESIPGFTVELSTDRLQRQVREIGCALVGQSPELAPADGILYALRDVTRTVDSVPLIASSVMSKKLAAGAGSIVLDVKHGAGAFMRNADRARELARVMVQIGEGAGRRVSALVSPMDHPLGRAVGNALEVREAMDTLRGVGPADLWALTRELGGELLRMSGRDGDLDALIASGAAMERWEMMVKAQGGDLSRLPAAPHRTVLPSPRGGRVRGIDARLVAQAVVDLGGGRAVKGAAIDHAVGVKLLVAVGDTVQRGDPLAEIHSRTSDIPDLRAAFTVADS